MNPKRIISLKKWVLVGLPVTLLLIFLASFYWLLHTTSGAAWLIHQVEYLSSATVHSARMDGDLASGLFIRDLEYRSKTMDVTVASAEIQATPVWWPVSIEVQVLSLKDIGVFNHAPTAGPGVKSDNADIRSLLASLKAPFPVNVLDAVLTNITLQEGNEPARNLFESLRFKATLDQDLVLDQIEILNPDFKAELQGYLGLEPPFALSAAAQGQVLLTGVANSTDLVFPFQLECSGSLDKLQFSLASPENGLQLNGEVLDPANQAEWDITARLDQMLWPLEGALETLTLSSLTLTSQGKVSDWSFKLSSGVSFDQLQDALLTISGSGSGTGIQITEAGLSGPGVDLGINGYLQWSPGSKAGVSAEIKQLDLSPWLQEWPAGVYLAGEFDLNWSETFLKIPTGRLTVTGSDLGINIGADIDIETNQVIARLDWTGLAWPLSGTTPDFSSSSGNMDVSGSLDKWLVDGQAAVKSGEYPEGRFDIRGGGNRTSTRLSIPGGEVLGGSISGEVEADWSVDLVWDATLQVRNFNPEQLLPGWPGRLDADLEIGATSQPEHMQIRIASLQGLLRGTAVSATGALAVKENALTFNTVEIRTDAAVLKLNGSSADPAGVTVEFNGQLPSALLDGARGYLELDGRYSGNSNNPVFDLHLEALDLAWNGFGATALSASTRKTAASETVPAFELDATGLAWQDRRFSELSLVFRPTGDQHRLNLNLVSEESVLKAGMTLKPENSKKPFISPWSGVLDELDVAINQTYHFDLLEPGSLDWSVDSASLGAVCLRENSGAGLCLSGDYQTTGDWSLSADVTAVPVDYMRDLLNMDVHFEQLLEGHLEWHQPHDRAPTGGAEFRITSGRILDLVGNEFLAETNEGRFAFSLQNGNLESGTLDLEFPGTGFIDLDFNVFDIVGDGAQRLEGRALVELDDIRLAGQMAFPGVDKVNGRFESNIQLGGTLTDPAFNGSFALSNGRIQYTPIGLKLEDIEMQGQVEKRDSGSFKGQFRSGEGVGSISGRFLFEDFQNIKADVALKGEQLTLIDTDNLKILTEVDLNFGLKPGRFDINGHIGVPSARLTPSNLLQEEVKDSEDLVIENHDAGLQTGANEKSSRNQVFGQLEVTLGDDVSVRVPNLETHINGRVLLDWSGDPVPLATGNFELNGKVAAYGQMLNIAKSSINFPAIPANNPLLNIRAEREIFGNTQIRSAGVQVIGTLKRPVLEAYTVPLTTEDRAWTLLVTGTDFDQSQGIGGFDVGAYIAPKLYVSYGISLFEDENVISARYDLKKGFGIKVTSGQRESGVDVSYTIDR